MWHQYFPVVVQLPVEAESLLPAPVPWRRMLREMVQLYIEMIVVVSAVTALPIIAVWMLVVQYSH